MHALVFFLLTWFEIQIISRWPYDAFADCGIEFTRIRLLHTSFRRNIMLVKQINFAKCKPSDMLVYAANVRPRA